MAGLKKGILIYFRGLVNYLSRKGHLKIKSSLPTIPFKKGCSSAGGNPLKIEYGIKQYKLQTI